MKPLIVPLFSNPENNGLHSVCGLNFVLSTNLYIKNQRDMSILIFFKTSSAGKPEINYTKRNTPLNDPDLKPLNCDSRFKITVQNAQNNNSAYLNFFKVSD